MAGGENRIDRRTFLGGSVRLSSGHRTTPERLSSQWPEPSPSLQRIQTDQREGPWPRLGIRLFLRTVLTQQVGDGGVADSLE
jgi:hypothetical protein